MVHKPGAGVTAAQGASGSSDGGAEGDLHPARPRVNAVRGKGFAVTSVVILGILNVSVAGSKTSVSPVAVLDTTCVTVACLTHVNRHNVVPVTVKCHQEGARELFPAIVRETCLLHPVEVGTGYGVVSDRVRRDIMTKIYQLT